MYVKGRTVFVTRYETIAFNQAWPCSELRTDREHWFTFETNGDLVDHNLTDREDGSAASAMADDCKAYLERGECPDWASCTTDIR